MSTTNALIVKKFLDNNGSFANACSNDDFMYFGRNIYFCSGTNKYEQELVATFRKDGKIELKVGHKSGAVRKLLKLLKNQIKQRKLEYIIS